VLKTAARGADSEAADGRHIAQRGMDSGAHPRGGQHRTELLDRLATLIRHRAAIATVITGCWGPCAAARGGHRVRARRDRDRRATAREDFRGVSAGARTALYHWAILLARLFATFPLLCPQCGAELRLIAFVTAIEPVKRRTWGSSRAATDRPGPPRRCAILLRLGTSPSVPTLGVHCSIAAHPPDRDDLLAPLPDWDALGQPAPEFELDQRISG